jgi:GMP synthase-like glutamine amidotransferase
MNNVIIVFQHEPNDGPCFFAEYLTSRGRPFAIFQMWQESAAALAPSTVLATFRATAIASSSPQLIPCDAGDLLCGVGGVACLGGYMSANDPLPYYATVHELFRSAVANGVPVIGHCLGAQLLSAALGGTVGASPEREIGWVRQCVCAPEPPLQAKDWFRGRKSLEVFHWHSESMSVPPGAFLVAKGLHCPNQAFQVGDGYVIGMQFHCEIDRSKALYYYREDRSTILSEVEAAAKGDNTACRMTREALEASLAADDTLQLVESRRLATDIYDTWCEGLK